ncbi:hypothetical protein, partial [Enterobacter hormaechei]|uniref:hypothetical protein n=1 Tax=Enterobacter hormaechei TaxID=158836 RepID=UPI001980225A
AADNPHEEGLLLLPLNRLVIKNITAYTCGGIIKLLKVIEELLNCLYLAAGLWDWLENHLPVFKAFALILV